MSKPTFTSSTGSAARLTRMVSPIPAHKSEPMPIVLFTVPDRVAPASVTPRCSGQSIASASCW